MSGYSEGVFKGKLGQLSYQQESIQAIALWMLHHRAAAHSAVLTWLDALTTGERHTQTHTHTHTHTHTPHNAHTHTHTPPTHDAHNTSTGKGEAQVPVSRE